MASREPTRPNILFCLADDQGAWAMGCAGNTDIRTPNLDRLAATGMRFENFFCASPVCSPARASILTGRIPSQHGVHDWLRAGNSTMEIDPRRGGQLTEYLAGQPGYTEALAAAGYVCGISGKWHLGDSHHTQKGFSFWEVHATGGGPYYNAPVIKDGEACREPSYISDFFTDNALRFLDAQADTEPPFYLSVHYTAPHSPWDRANHPAETWDAYRATCEFNATPRLPMHPWQINSAPTAYDEDGRRDILSGYYTAITEMDRNIGRLVDWLEAHGLRENTVVIFSSDNGMNIGHHGIFGKGNGTFPLNMYDTSVKVPMLISRPGSVPAGVVDSHLLSHLDIYSTLLDYVGLTHPEAASLPGQSFAPLLREEVIDGRDNVIICDEYGPVRMVRDQAWKYVHRYPYGPHELYHLETDPDEEHNLFTDPDCQVRIVQMRATLDEWFHRYVNPAIDGAREGVTGKGQLTWAGVKAQGAQVYETDWYHLTGRVNTVKDL